ncbi:hypothetical protein MRB53_038364 [Persea americana]|nr:hypothetical protein MRB53_038364 [Persea americana]
MYFHVTLPPSLCVTSGPLGASGWMSLGSFEHVPVDPPVGQPLRFLWFSNHRNGLATAILGQSLPAVEPPNHHHAGSPKKDYHMRWPPQDSVEQRKRRSFQPSRPPLLVSGKGLLVIPCKRNGNAAAMRTALVFVRHVGCKEEPRGQLGRSLIHIAPEDHDHAQGTWEKYGSALPMCGQSTRNAQPRHISRTSRMLDLVANSLPTSSMTLVACLRTLFFYESKWSTSASFQRLAWHDGRRAFAPARNAIQRPGSNSAQSRYARRMGGWFCISQLDTRCCYYQLPSRALYRLALGETQACPIQTCRGTRTRRTSFNKSVVDYGHLRNARDLPPPPLSDAMFAWCEPSASSQHFGHDLAQAAWSRC